MNDQRTVKKYWALAALLGVTFAASGCDTRTSSGNTVGQSVDKALDKTNQTAGQAGQRIGEAAKDTAETVKNKAGQVGAVLDDTAITAAVKAGLISEPGLSALKIDVDTVKGEVTLQGEVNNDDARTRAERIASSVSGVVKVNNSLRVKG